MKYRSYKSLSLLITVAGILSGCSDHIEFAGMGNSGLLLTLDASYPSATRASDAGFEDGDLMGIYVLDYYGDTPQNIATSDINAANIRFEFHGADCSWKGVSNIYWSTPDTPADVIAYYPFNSNIDTPQSMPFSVEKKQNAGKTVNSKGGYEKSDLLWGIMKKQMPTAGKVQMTLRHIMAGVRVTLIEGSGFAKDEWASLEKRVTVNNTKLSGAVNLSDGNASVANTESATILPLEYEGQFRAVVFPQTVDALQSLISITVGTDGYNLVKNDPMVYISGKLHSFSITVDKKNSGNLSFSLTDEGITPWIDEAEFRDGIIRSYTVVNVEKKGSLKSAVLSSGLNYKILTNLKVTGEINEDDFAFMRDEMTSLKALHLYDVAVYEGERKGVIPRRAMYCKSTLTRIVFPKELKIIGSDAFHRTGLMGDLLIPEGVEKIGEITDEAASFNVGDHVNGDSGAFSYCQNLLGTLQLPSTLTHIEHGAFDYCEFDGSLFLPENLEFIGAYAFNRTNFDGSLYLPANLTYLGSGAFAHTKFTGSLEIPEGITVIKQYAFQDSHFSGALLLPQGLVEIQARAFENCRFSGELALPSSVVTLGNYAFAGTRIRNIVFSENLTSIGKGCFANCEYHSGRLVVPKNVNRINEYAFSGSPLLSEIELHENVVYVGGAAFAGDVNVSEFKILNPEPPAVGYVTNIDGYIDGFPAEGYTLSPIYGIAEANVVLKVPDEARDKYSRAEVWRNIGRHVSDNGFGCRPEKISVLNNSHMESVIVDGEGEWEISHIPSWCKASANSGSGKTQLTLSVDNLPKGQGDRVDYVEFKIKGTDYTSRCEIVQKDYRYDEDECVTLQNASVGSGIDVLFVAEGFDASSIADGKYLDLVYEQMDAFFGIEPYATYRDRFNVYACVSLSQDNGVSTTSTHKNTKFSVRYDNGTGCSEKGLAFDDADAVFEYAVSKSPLTLDKMSKSLIIMALNSDVYGSVTTITENGSSIAVVGKSSDPYPWDTRGMLQHEACGHAFGKLAEERITSNRYISSQNAVMYRQSMGWYQNISLSGKLSDVHWSNLIFDSRYSDKVDVFEGAYGVTRGVYRAEINSCMNYGIPYFSAPARLDIMRRILQYSGEEFTMDKFYATDSDKWGPAETTTRASMPDNGQQYISSGMHHPVRFVKSKKY